MLRVYDFNVDISQLPSYFFIEFICIIVNLIPVINAINRTYRHKSTLSGSISCLILMHVFTKLYSRVESGNDRLMDLQYVLWYNTPCLSSNAELIGWKRVDLILYRQMGMIAVYSSVFNLLIPDARVWSLAISNL